jgi:hypothetical protein
LAQSARIVVAEFAAQLPYQMKYTWVVPSITAPPWYEMPLPDAVAPGSRIAGASSR